jgi:hypothetical protein
LTRALQSSEEKLEDVLVSSNKKPRLDVDAKAPNVATSNETSTALGAADTKDTKDAKEPPMAGKLTTGTLDKDFVTYTSKGDAVTPVSAHMFSLRGGGGEGPHLCLVCNPHFLWLHFIG